jgi:hypothetical protein
MQTLATITDGTASMARPQPMSPPMNASTVGLGRTSLIGTIGGRVDDALLLLVVVFLFPAGILLIGMPIAVCARVALEIARRL